MLQKPGISSVCPSARPSYLILVSVTGTFKHWEKFSLHLQTPVSRFNVLSAISLISLSSAELCDHSGARSYGMTSLLGAEEAQNLSGPSSHHIMPPSRIFTASIKTNKGM